MNTRSCASVSLLAFLTIAILPVCSGAELVQPAVGLGSGAMASLPAAGTHGSTNAGELREAFAIANQERNLIRDERNVLAQEKWFVVFYALAISIFTAWLGRHLLRRSSLIRGPHQQELTQKMQAPVHPRDATTVRMIPRRNATITIRNGETQQPEVIAQVATRRYFTSPSPAPIKPALMKHALAEQLGSSTEPHPATEADSEDDYAPTVNVAPKRTTAVMANGEPHKPATRPTFRLDPYPDYFGSDQGSRYESVFARKRA